MSSSMTSTLNFWITLAVLFVCAGVVGFLSWQERQPRKSLEPRLIPTTPVIIIFVFIALVALVHLANLYGIKTGRR